MRKLVVTITFGAMLSVLSLLCLPSNAHAVTCSGSYTASNTTAIVYKPSTNSCSIADGSGSDVDTLNLILSPDYSPDHYTGAVLLFGPTVIPPQSLVVGGINGGLTGGGTFEVQHDFTGLFAATLIGIVFGFSQPFEMTANLRADGGSNIYIVDASVSAVPLPAALPLFATGLGALGLLGWRRKRKQVAA